MSDLKLPEIEYEPSTIAMSNASREASSFYKEHRFGDGPAWFSAAEQLAYRALIREDQLQAALRESAADKRRIAELEAERNFAREERDRLEQERGDWAGEKCSACDGYGEIEDARRCDKCGGTGDVWMTWKARAERAESQLAIARDLIESMKREDRWIPVEERLPEAGVNVLIIAEGFYSTSQQYTAYRSEPMTEDSPIFWRDSHTGAKTIYATHWRPLPAPPESMRKEKQA